MLALPKFTMIFIFAITSTLNHHDLKSTHKKTNHKLERLSWLLPLVVILWPRPLWRSLPLACWSVAIPTISIATSYAWLYWCSAIASVWHSCHGWTRHKVLLLICRWCGLTGWRWHSECPSGSLTRQRCVAGLSPWHSWRTIVPLPSTRGIRRIGIWLVSRPSWRIFRILWPWSWWRRACRQSTGTRTCLTGWSIWPRPCRLEKNQQLSNKCMLHNCPEWDKLALNKLIHYEQWFNILIPRWPTVSHVA